jgi:hypothetical protein
MSKALLELKFDVCSLIISEYHPYKRNKASNASSNSVLSSYPSASSTAASLLHAPQAMTSLLQCRQFFPSPSADMGAFSAAMHNHQHLLQHQHSPSTYHQTSPISPANSDHLSDSHSHVPELLLHKPDANEQSDNM